MTTFLGGGVGGAYGCGVGGGKSPMLARTFLVVVEVVVQVFLGGLEVALEEIVVLVLWSLVVWRWIWEVVMWVKDEVLMWCWRSCSCECWRRKRSWCG